MMDIEKVILKINTAISDLKSGIKTAQLTDSDKEDIISDLEEVIALVERMKDEND